jgi:hypothetical protein
VSGGDGQTPDTGRPGIRDSGFVESTHEDPGLGDAWLQEIRRRRELIASGEVEPLDEDEMFARIEARRK